jgi:hypothetical protein
VLENAAEIWKVEATGRHKDEDGGVETRCCCCCCCMRVCLVVEGLPSSDAELGLILLRLSNLRERFVLDVCCHVLSKRE